MALSHFHDTLTHHQRQRIVDGSRGDLQSLNCRGLQYLTIAEFEDIVRLAVDNYFDMVGEEREINAHDEGAMWESKTGAVGA